MKERYIFRLILWSLLLIITSICGVYGLLENLKRSPNTNEQNASSSTNETVSDTFIVTSDLKLNESNIKNGSFDLTKGNIKLSITNNDKPVITIKETPTLTENAYKSIISVIEIIFEDTKYTNYFKENYNSITIGSKTFNGFEIKVLGNSIIVTITKEQINL